MVHKDLFVCSEKASFNSSSDLDLNQFSTKDLSVKFNLDLELTTEYYRFVNLNINSKMVCNKSLPTRKNRGCVTFKVQCFAMIAFHL